MTPNKVERETARLAEHTTIPRVIIGCWQLAGGHGSIDPETAIENLTSYFAAGFRVFDCADIYPGVEQLLGHFSTTCRSKFGATANDLRIHTKFVPDLQTLPTINPRDVEDIIDRSLVRLQTERLDLVQFHWWDLGIPGYVETAQVLAELKKRGKIAHLALTNFDVPQVEEIISAGVPIVFNQVQFSMCDPRPQRDMVRHAAARGYRLLAYGTVAGGFLSDRYLNVPRPREPLENRSLVKYMLMIDELGGWDAFQGLLRTIHQIAMKHDTSITNVAVRHILDHDQVAAVVLGARNTTHIEETLSLFKLNLDADDRSKLDHAIAQRSSDAGGVYELERTGHKHKTIMKYNLNSAED